MSYPSLPFALVHFLASNAAERAGLNKNAKNVSIVAQHDKSSRARRLAITQDSHWQEVVTTALAMVAEQPTDTLSIIYPSSDGSPTDVGVLIEGGRPPMVFTWTFAPAFLMTLVLDGENRRQVLEGAGVRETQAILDRIYNAAGGGGVVPAVEAGYREPEVLTVLAPDGSKLD